MRVMLELRNPCKPCMAHSRHVSREVCVWMLTGAITVGLPRQVIIANLAGNQILVVTFDLNSAASL